MNIDWDGVRVYVVDPVCRFPDLQVGYERGCRCQRCTDYMRRHRGQSERGLCYIPESEWLT